MAARSLLSAVSAQRLQEVLEDMAQYAHAHSLVVCLELHLLSFYGMDTCPPAMITAWTPSLQINDQPNPCVPTWQEN